MKENRRKEKKIERKKMKISENNHGWQWRQ
jgi:hypothetical protein